MHSAETAQPTAGVVEFAGSVSDAVLCNQLESCDEQDVVVEVAEVPLTWSTSVCCTIIALCR